ncbi:zeta toxin family protein [soil metagenome]
MDKPYIIVVGGPNGAGKSTIARRVFAETVGLHEFVNADVIATGLSAFNPQSKALAAGRVMLARLRELAEQRLSFAFESTLSSRTFAVWLREQQIRGYEISVIYIFLRNRELSEDRVRIRVAGGGHDIPVEDLRRRFGRSAWNFINLYAPLADSWAVYDNSEAEPETTATFDREDGLVVFNEVVWSQLNEIAKRQEDE